MRRRRPDMQRTARRSMWRFREGCCIFTYCSSEAVLYSEKSSCLLPWCAQCRLSGRWWTVSLWTTGSPLHSVSASRFRYSSLQLSGLCKREAAFHCYLPETSWACRMFFGGWLVVCSGVKHTDTSSNLQELLFFAIWGASEWGCWPFQMITF